MSDIVGRLRAKEYGGVERLMDEAADEIERLRACVREQMRDQRYSEDDIERTIHPRPWGMIISHD